MPTTQSLNPESRRNDPAGPAQQIKAKQAYWLKQMRLLVVVVLGVIAVIAGLWAASENLGTIKDILTIIGGPLAIAYFVYRVGYQKQFQRLSPELLVTILGPCGGGNLVEIACKIKNESECRIDFYSAVYEVYDGTKNFGVDNPELLKDKFPANLYRASDKNGRVAGFSVDAKSEIILANKGLLPAEVRIIFVAAEFSPKLTGDAYVVSRWFPIVPTSAL